jgi:PIN domain nuclease of toxin-antitoxin system
MKWLREKVLNIWWKYRGKKHAKVFKTYDVARYGRVITVVRFHDALLIVSEYSIWEISENYSMGRLETHIIAGGRI